MTSVREPRATCLTDKCKYYGFESTDGYCSECYRTIHGLPYPISERTIYRNKMMFDTSQESTDAWLQSGIYVSNKFTTDCSICFEEKYTSHRYACVCEPSICKECALRADKCPFCRANKYYRLTVDDLVIILNILNSRYDESMSKIMRLMRSLIIKYSIDDTNISMRNFIASTRDIVLAIVIHKSSTGQVLCNDGLYDIFGFSINPWKIGNECDTERIYHGGCLESQFCDFSFYREGYTYNGFHHRRFSANKFLKNFKLE
ncbi:MAG: hypothetical protein Gaeavirus4_21 [Gaeavirus sp.]|uniref:RING-type domain-containing protein n=1 Tax=Gaeavirus sp. TaxID=2487767 RepID=A0A3G4ZYL0_9VIRU|nr:MAG: hypothetical protein Gaeavirus4_21 [Gaeavirus sp.]